MRGSNAISGSLKRAKSYLSNNLDGWDDVADDGWENSQSGSEWEDVSEPMDDPKD